MAMAEKKNVRSPFRADHVGSFLRPERLKKARAQKQKGEITAEQLKQVEDEEIIKLVEKQKKAGLQSVTDGEFRRAWWHFDFLEGLDGVEGYDAERGLQFTGVETKKRGIKVTSKIGFTDHDMIDHYRFLHNIAGDAVAKFAIPSPNMLLFRADFEEGVYANDAEVVADLIAAYQGVVQKLYDEGCRYLQLDDTAWASFFSEESRQAFVEKGKDPEKLVKLAAQAVNGAIVKRPEDMIVTMHICRGNFQSTYMSSGSYEAVSEVIFGELQVDGLFLEFDDERSGGFEPLRHVNRKDLYVVLGLITSKFADLENPESVQSRIAEAAEYVSLEQLCLSPQCGFASTEEGNLLSEAAQWEKIRHVVKIAENMWK